MRYAVTLLGVLLGVLLTAAVLTAPAAPAATKATFVGEGGDFGCAIVKGGALKCWGYNGYGQLGDGTLQDRHTPVKVKKLGKVRILRAGYYQSCAVTPKGAAKCWGYRSEGQLGDGSFSRALDPDYAKLPAQVFGLTSGVTDISPNYYYTCAVHKGAAKCWGRNDHGQLGVGSFGINFAAPVQVKGLQKNVTQISAGWYGACALVKSGVASCWGYNEYGDLGNGTTDDSAKPVKVKL